jgi:hypothetical protein
MPIELAEPPAKVEGHLISLHVTLSDRLMHEILTTAFEAGAFGIGYWCCADKVERDSESWVTSLEAYDTDEPETLFGKVDAEVIARGIRRILAEQKCNDYHRDSVARLVLTQDTCSIDANDADVIVQVGLFNELVYG